ncbi:hypothetical protein BT69DRAFT_1347667 [Atractiella rhizophila]|nr:hypothetical protein BT69DRAFT_1347667 [Atractiella rhizophila]
MATIYEAPLCDACKEHGIFCARQHLSSCDRCLTLGIACTFSHPLAIKASNSRGWALKELKHKTGYSSSRHLQHDLYSIGVVGKPKKRKLGKNSSQSQKKIREASKIQSRRVVDLAATFIRHTQIGSDSVDGKLASFQVASFVGDHLLQLSTNQLLRFLTDITGLDYPTSWTSFVDLKSKNSDLAECIDAWICACLAVGATRSWHPVILGSAALKEQPVQTLKDDLLDLRRCGNGRKGIRWDLVNQCLSGIIAAPFILAPTIKNLTIISALLGMFLATRPNTFHFALLQIGIDHFSNLLLKIDDQAQRAQFIQKHFHILWFADTIFHSEERTGGGLPFFTDCDIQRLFGSAGLDPSPYIDPRCLHSRSLHGKAIEVTDTYWKTAVCFRRHITITGHSLSQDDITQAAVEAACTDLLNISLEFRQSRQEHFARSPPSNPPNASTASYYVGPGGEETITDSRVVQTEESINSFYMSRVISDASQRFPQSDRLLTLWKCSLKVAEEQIGLTLALWDYIVDVCEVENKPIFSTLSNHQGLIRSFRWLPNEGWRFLVHWQAQFPEYKSSLERLVKIWKYLAFTAYEFSNNIEDYEDELAQLKDTHSLEHPVTAIPSDLVSRDASTQQDQATKRDSSPDLADFAQTLFAI